MRTQCERNAPPPPPSIPLSNDNGAPDIWGPAVAYLGERKRPMIGKWVRDYGPGETAKAVTEAQLNRAVDPIAYIERVLRGSSQREPVIGI